jgi:hypothetical protein
LRSIFSSGIAGVFFSAFSTFSVGVTKVAIGFEPLAVSS